MAFKQANSAGSMSSSLYVSSTEFRPVRPEAREGERSGNWSREKMVEEWRGRHHWMEQSRNSSDQLSSSSRAWDYSAVSKILNDRLYVPPDHCWTELRRRPSSLST